MRIGTLCLVTLISLGCGASTTGGASSTTTDLTPEAQTAKFCGDVVGPFCDALFGCCADPQVLSSFGGSSAACRTRFASSCKNDIGDVILPVARSGATVLDQTRLGACVASLGAMTAGGAACMRAPQIMALQDCVAAFQGQLDPGAACDAFAVSGDIEFVPCKAGTCKNGTCNAYLAAGAACDPTTNDVSGGGCNFPDGYNCAGTGTVGHCVKRGAVGDACDLNAGGFSCESLTCVAGKCAGPSPVTICQGG